MKKNLISLMTGLLLCVQAFAADAAKPAGNPNVIIVLTDDQGYGDLSLTGNPLLKTPNMDRLAREGVQLRNFHVDAYCTPTRSALMTGRYSHRVGGWGTINGRNMLRDDEVTMADVFRHNGYQTGHFGKWHLGTSYPYRPIDRGFGEWLGHGDGGTGCTTDYWGNDRVNDYYIHNGKWEAEPRAGYECDVFFNAAMAFVRANKQQPFFTYLAVYNPHNPCSIPDPKWADLYKDKKAPEDFFASIARIDENLGRLRQFLKEEGLAENTLLIFMSDNGTAGGDKVFNAGMRGKKGSPYDGGHRVPCFLSWPAGGFGAPATVDRLTAHLDLLPTLVDLCALQLPKPVKFDGVSLKPLLENAKADWPDRTIILGTPPNRTGSNMAPPPFGENCSVMSDQWRWVNDKKLYDMARDPGQQHDVAKEHSQVVKDLKAAYAKYFEDVSRNDKGWRGRPIIGAPQALAVDLCGEDWLTTQGSCPWNQGAVAAGAAAFGRWPVRVAEAGAYRVEVRRWPRELNTPIVGIPTDTKIVDAWLDGGPVHGTLYKGNPKALPVAKTRLKIGADVQEADVASGDTVKAFMVHLNAGSADIEATLLDSNGKPLCSAFYVTVVKTENPR